MRNFAAAAAGLCLGLLGAGGPGRRSARARRPDPAWIAWSPAS